MLRYTESLSPHPQPLCKQVKFQRNRLKDRELSIMEVLYFLAGVGVNDLYTDTVKEGRKMGQREVE